MLVGTFRGYVLTKNGYVMVRYVSDWVRFDQLPKNLIGNTLRPLVNLSWLSVITTRVRHSLTCQIRFSVYFIYIICRLPQQLRNYVKSLFNLLCFKCDSCDGSSD